MEDSSGREVELSITSPEFRNSQSFEEMLMSTPFFIPHLQTRAGEFYYTVDCPVEKRPVPFERDASHGREPFDKGPLIFSCPYCQVMHELLDPQVTSLQVQKKE